MSRLKLLRSAAPAMIIAALAQAAAPVAIAQDFPIQAQSLSGGPGSGPATVRVDLGSGGATRTLALPRGKSAVIELPVDVRDILITNPAVADAVLRTPRQIYVLGMTSGQTDAILFDASGRRILSLNIRVDADFGALAETINRVLPGARVQVEPIGDAVILTGMVANAGDADKAAQIALRYVSKPDLCLLDINMPGMGGLDVARAIKAGAAPLVVFVTAYDEFAIQAFEVNAIDYLLKPVERERLVETVERARTFATASLAVRSRGLAAVSVVGASARRTYLERIPVRRRDDTVIVLVRDLASVVADGELLHLTTVSSERFTISHRLHALEARLDPRRFVRLGRGTLVAVDRVRKFSAMPGGTYEVHLTNGQVMVASRIQSRVLRESFLRI